MGTYTRYTAKEDSIILQCISENPENLSSAIKRASKLTGRSIGGINFRWYHRLSKKAEEFALKSENSYLKNRKVVKEKVLTTSGKVIKMSNATINIGGLTITGDMEITV